MTRAAILCPGRGSYDEAAMGSLPADHEWIRQAEAIRAELSLEPLIELDTAPKFEPSRHLRAANAAALIYTKSMLDAARTCEEYDVVCVGGNSMGWYTALAAAGALDFADGFELVQRMALLQEEGEKGGQLVYPVVDADWRPDPAAETAVAAALVGAPGEAFPSIELGGYRVLAGSPKGIAHLSANLPKVQIGRVTYPLRLAGHGPYHTVLADSVARAAQRELEDLGVEAPRTTLVDGRGVRHTPWSADPEELLAYTLGAQVTDPFDLTTCVRVMLREHAPERIVLPGPGNTLGGVVGQILVREGWRGIRSRADFTAAQESDRPVIVSMGR